MPSDFTVTPASGVSCGLDTTVRPSNEVVGATTAREAAPDCATGRLSTVAEAVIDRFAVAIAWLAGAVSVRTAVWPAATEGGANAAVTPAGTPVTLNCASWSKLFALLNCTA